MPAKLKEWEMQDLGRLLDDREQTHFSAQLVRLIKKADADNRDLIALGFPGHVAAVELWESSGGKPLFACQGCGLVTLFEDTSRACNACGRWWTPPAEKGCP